MKNTNLIAARIKSARIKENLTQEEVGSKIGVHKSTIMRWENGEGTGSIKLPVIEALASMLDVTPSYLMGWSDASEKLNLEPMCPSDCRTYPIIGEVAAGFGSEAYEEETGDYEQIPLKWLRGHDPNNFFVLQVKGDSMYPKFIAGDRVLVHRQTTVDSGSIAVVLYDGNIATVKQVKYVNGEDWVDLIPTNPEFQTKRVEGVDLEQCRVLGEVKRLIRIIK